MSVIDFTSTVIAGYGPPKFVKIVNGSVEKSIELSQPDGAHILRFVPKAIEYTDVNNIERNVHLGWNVELEFGYAFLSAANAQKVIEVYSWRLFDPNRLKIQCYPHIDFPNFSFFGRFDGNLDFNYPGDKYIGHAFKLLFRSTEMVQAIPNTTNNIIVHRRTM